VGEGKGSDMVSDDENAGEVGGGLGDDQMRGWDGADLIRADEAGIDAVNAGSGDVVVDAHDDAGTDTITYGEGTDTVGFDARVDAVAADCENSGPH
jgi:hypothetical protein